MYDIQKIISDLKQIAAECEKVTSGNVSHRIANIEHGILNIADYLENYCPLGWHPASEPPIIPKGKNWIKVIALVDYGDGLLRPKHEIYKDKGWNNLLNWKIEWWCYPPKEE